MAESRFSETIAQLEAELPGIEARRRRLEDELTGAVARENAVRGAIEGLRALTELVASQDMTPVGGVRAEVDAIVGDRPQQLAAETGAALHRGGEPAEEGTLGTDTVSRSRRGRPGAAAQQIIMLSALTPGEDNQEACRHDLRSGRQGCDQAG
ncbi:hypothetical protein AB0A71_30250 [Kitasatospora aureofaciens]|uniref:hypothetical protein n=1 Tax=Kitasatospora aureofaciens TaxID=1894 RepID=UPI0033CF0B48